MPKKFKNLSNLPPSELNSRVHHREEPVSHPLKLPAKRIFGLYACVFKDEIQSC